MLGDALRASWNSRLRTRASNQRSPSASAGGQGGARWKSIKDGVAMIGIGTTKVGERWEAGPEDLLFEACSEALADARIEPKDIDAG